MSFLTNTQDIGFDTRKLLYRNLAFLMLLVFFVLLFLTVRNERVQQFVDISRDFSFFLVVLLAALWMKTMGIYICLLLGIIDININLFISPVFSLINSIETIQFFRNLSFWISFSIFAIYLLSHPNKSPFGFLKRKYLIKDYFISLPSVLIIVVVQLAIRQL